MSSRELLCDKNDHSSLHNLRLTLHTFKLLTSAPRVGKKMNLNITNEWIIQSYCFLFEARQKLFAWMHSPVWNLTALPGMVSSSSHAKFWTKPLDAAVRNELLSSARKNRHLKEHLLSWSDWPKAIKMMLNNPLSIERGGLASSQCDFIFQDRANVFCPES